MSKTNSMKKEIEEYLKTLRLAGIRKLHEEISRKAEKESLGYETYLRELLLCEVTERREHRIERNLRRSGLSLEKTFSTFEMKRLPMKVRNQVQTLRGGCFLDRKENVLMFGKPGSGKTHVLCAIGHELIVADRRIYFTTCSTLVQELLIAKRDLKLPKILKAMRKYDAVIIDDLGYVQQNREEMEVLFTFLADRYERGSVMITSNLPFSKWEKIFKDPMTTAAAIDRLVHHSVILELNLSSYRVEQAKKTKGKVA